ncbi:MAG TPA: DUF4191 domain-containing protein [Mycobacteriales bacterium]|nr:DUF4191 domain-containing protein [Mycobacteriales bacterium]
MPKTKPETATPTRAGKSTRAPKGPSKRAAIRQTIKATAKADKKFVPLVAGAFVLTTAVVAGIGFAVGSPILFTIFGVLFGIMAALIVTGRRASAAAFAGIEGQPGAAAAVLSSMRGHWHVTPAVGITRQQDFVHRVVGRPGVVLVAEGAGMRPRELLTAELRRTRRLIGDTPLYDVVVGEGQGQVPIERLQTHLMKLPRNIKPRAVNELEARLKAVGGMAMPLPKGPLPGMGGKMPRPKQR